MNPVAIKAEYITGNLSLSALALQHGVKRSTLSDLARKEDWAGARQAYRTKVLRQITERCARADASAAEALGSAARTLCNLLDQVLRDERTVYDQQDRQGFAASDVRAVRDVTAALKELSAMLQQLQGETADKQIQVQFTPEVAECTD